MIPLTNIRKDDLTVLGLAVDKVVSIGGSLTSVRVMTHLGPAPRRSAKTEKFDMLEVELPTTSMFSQMDWVAIGDSGKIISLGQNVIDLSDLHELAIRIVKGELWKE